MYGISKTLKICMPCFLAHYKNDVISLFYGIQPPAQDLAELSLDAIAHDRIAVFFCYGDSDAGLGPIGLAKNQNQKRVSQGLAPLVGDLKIPILLEPIALIHPISASWAGKPPLWFCREKASHK